MYDETKGDEIDLAGSLLLAHPNLTDPNFKQAVVLITAHGEEGSVGVVLNRSQNLTLNEVNTEFATYGLSDVPLYSGGPVNENQILLAGWELLPETNEFKLYFGLQPEEAQRRRLESDQIVLRAFQGYSGWSEGQLLEELEGNAWVVSNVDGEAINSLEGKELWSQIIMEINPELGLLSLAPETPDEN